MIPVDVVSILRADLNAQRNEPDGLLHASSDLVGSLRHSQLHFVGAPRIESDITSDIRTRTGWFWHDHIGTLLTNAGVPVMREVNLGPWMPDGWTGTADWVFYSPEYEAFCLGDLKTTKGEAIKFREREGMSEEHYWQLSAYWHALVSMGLPMVKGFVVMYLPMSTNIREPSIRPIMLEAEPADEEAVVALMDERLAAVREYARSIPPEDEWMGWSTSVIAENLINDNLAPPLERQQELFWDYKKKIWNVKLVPHWLTDFCPYDNELCDCSEQGETKIGHWEWKHDPGAEDVREELIYHPRKDSKVDFTNLEPTVFPDKREVKRRVSK